MERALEVPELEDVVEERTFLRCAWARMERNSEVRSCIDVTAIVQFALVCLMTGWRCQLANVIVP